MSLNLDAASEHCNTFSVFQNGRRMGLPVKLPEALKGKVRACVASLSGGLGWFVCVCAGSIEQLSKQPIVFF